MALILKETYKKTSGDTRGEIAEELIETEGRGGVDRLILKLWMQGKFQGETPDVPAYLLDAREEDEERHRMHNDNGSTSDEKNGEEEDEVYGRPSEEGSDPLCPSIHDTSDDEQNQDSGPESSGPSEVSQNAPRPEGEGLAEVFHRVLNDRRETAECEKVMEVKVMRGRQAWDAWRARHVSRTKGRVHPSGSVVIELP